MGQFMQPGMKNALSETAGGKRASTVPSSLWSGRSFFGRPCDRTAAHSQHQCPPDHFQAPCPPASPPQQHDVPCCFCGGFQPVQQQAPGYRRSEARVSSGINQAPDSSIHSNSNSSITHQRRLPLTRSKRPPRKAPHEQPAIRRAEQMLRSKPSLRARELYFGISYVSRLQVATVPEANAINRRREISTGVLLQHKEDDFGAGHIFLYLHPQAACSYTCFLSGVLLR